MGLRLKQLFFALLILGQSGMAQAALSILAGTTTKAHTTSTSVDLTFPGGTPTAGNLLVCGMTEYANPPTATLSDNQSGNSYVQLNTGWTRTTSDNQNSTRMFYVGNINVSGTFTIHFTALPTSPSFAAFCYEVAGADATTPFIGGELATNNGTSSGAGAVTAPTVTNSNVNSAIFSVIATAGPGGAVITAGASYTLDATNARETDGTTYETGGLEYRIVSASPNTPTWTINNSIEWAGVTAAFQQAAGGGAAVIFKRPQFKNYIRTGAQ